MKLLREDLLNTLKIASVGAALPPRMVVLEQSDCFIFRKGQLVTFNDEILTRTPSPLNFDTIVHAGDFLKILGKLPDRYVEILPAEGELIVKGKRRSCGIATQAQLALPYKDVPRAKKFSKVREGVTGMLKQAARTCGKDLSNPMTTVVHAAPDVIEACDNFRLFRAGMKTGFLKGILLPAPALNALESIPLYRVAVWKGWTHFRTSKKLGEGTVISVRCINEADYKDMDLLAVLKMGKDTETVKLPGNLADMVERSEVMSEGSDPLVQITIAKKTGITIRMAKDSGWYKEQKKIRYTGKDLKFHVNPKFLVEVLQRTTTVKIGGDKMKLEVDGIKFVVVLEKSE